MTDIGATRPAQPSLRLSAVHLFTLTGFAVAQPIYDLLERYPTFLVAHGAGLGDVVALAVGCSLGAPLLLIVGEALLGSVSSQLRWSLHLTCVAGLVGLAALPPLNRLLALPPVPALSVAALIGIVAAVAYARRAALRTLCTGLAAAALAFAAIFVARAPVAPFVRGGATTTAAPVAVAHPAPLVVVIFDELSLFSLMDAEGGIDAVRFPHFAALAEVSTWYRNATAVADYTPLAVPAILTGRLPDHNRVPIAAEHPDNLFTLLAGRYRLVVSEPVTSLCPAADCPHSRSGAETQGQRAALFTDSLLLWLHMLAPAEWRPRLPDIGRQWTFQFERWLIGQLTGVVSSNRARSFRDFLDRIDPTPEPTLFFIHALLPHYPYEYLPSGARYAAPPADFHRQRLDPAHPESMLGWAADNRAGAAQEQQRYLLQLGLVDTLLGQLLEQLRAAGLFDDALLVVTADHGVSFRAGESQRWLTATNAADILWVPLFIKLPQQRLGRIDDRNVQTIDVLPTIADALGVTIPWRIDGVSALGDQPGAAEKVAFTPVTPRDLLDLTRRVLPPERPLRPDVLQARLQLFGSGTQISRLFAYGPYPALIGQPAEIVHTSPPASYSVTLESPERFRDVVQGSGNVPSFVRGRLTPSAAVGTPPALAIAVNGRIAATTDAFIADDRSISFGALVSDAAFRGGANDIAIYAIHLGTDGTPVLQPLQ
ncbi:MAG: sulfatase-like hydrolase/transferase [bacterium]